jgi:primosomal protein N' (replication factor Y)
MSDAPFIAVVLDQNLTRPLDYAVPLELQGLIRVGMRVEVPLKSKLVKATVVAIKKSSSVPGLKAVERLLSTEAVHSDNMGKLAHWMASYYAAPLQKVMKCFVPPSVRKGAQSKQEWFVSLKISKEKALALIPELRTKKPLHAQILEELLQKTFSRSALMEQLNISLSPLETLKKKGWIAWEQQAAKEIFEEEFFPSLPKTLTDEQEKSFKSIQATIQAKIFSTHLIQGVTGSGKTEIYLQAIQETLNMGRSAIMLVPEVALTSQTIERFRSRFQQKIAIWHHRRSLGERTAAWDLLRKGEAQIVIGARSAIFCPAQNVGLIIVDEEHDSSYKQSDDTPCYHGRDIAVMRASIEKATVLLGSATPAIESRYNADIGKYQLHKLLKRPSGATLPRVQIVDMKETYQVNGGFTHFSSPLVDALKKRLELGEQTLLFLNRRGYHRLQVCSKCRHIIKCPHCDLGLTYHKSAHHLRCHLCNHEQPVPLGCPSCGERESLRFQGFGTEHVERSLHALLPGIRTLRMDRDTTQKKTSHEDLYKQFRAHKADVLIGTQMIAKGFHFPSVTLVGVLNADASLSIPDFRSAEQVFQLITQVAGRAGRSALPGEMILQTFLPDHPVIKMASSQDYETFYATELAERKLFAYPPFCQLIKVSCYGKNEEETAKKAEALHQKIKEKLPEGTELLPVMPAGHAKVKDIYRFQFIIKALKISPIALLLSSLVPQEGYKIDVNPTSTFF